MTNELLKKIKINHIRIIGESENRRTQSERPVIPYKKSFKIEIDYVINDTDTTKNENFSFQVAPMYRNFPLHSIKIKYNETNQKPFSAEGIHGVKGAHELQEKFPDHSCKPDLEHSIPQRIALFIDDDHGIESYCFDVRIPIHLPRFEDGTWQPNNLYVFSEQLETHLSEVMLQINEWIHSIPDTADSSEELLQNSPQWSQNFLKQKLFSGMIWLEGGFGYGKSTLLGKIASEYEKKLKEYLESNPAHRAPYIRIFTEETQSKPVVINLGKVIFKDADALHLVERVHKGDKNASTELKKLICVGAGSEIKKIVDMHTRVHPGQELDRWQYHISEDIHSNMSIDQIVERIFTKYAYLSQFYPAIVYLFDEFNMLWKEDDQDSSLLKKTLYDSLNLILAPWSYLISALEANDGNKRDSIRRIKELVQQVHSTHFLDRGLVVTGVFADHFSPDHKHRFDSWIELTQSSSKTLPDASFSPTDRIGHWWHVTEDGQKIKPLIQIKAFALSSKMSPHDIESMLDKIPLDFDEQARADLADRIWIWTRGHVYSTIALLRGYLDILMNTPKSDRRKLIDEVIPDAVTIEAMQNRDLLKYLVKTAYKGNGNNTQRTTDLEEKLLREIAQGRRLVDMHDRHGSKTLAEMLTDLNRKGLILVNERNRYEVLKSEEFEKPVISLQVKIANPLLKYLLTNRTDSEGAT